jgi:hypothetical protein
MKKSLLDRLVSCAAVMVVVGLLSFGSGSTKFSAGAEGCTQATVAGTKCDGVSGETCTWGVNKCTSGTSYSSCEDGKGNGLDCTTISGCSGGTLHHPKTNATGC